VETGFCSAAVYCNHFFSKFLTIQMLLIFFFLLFNAFMIGAGLVGNVINPSFTFFEHSISWLALLKLNAKTYISILGISAIQYVLSLQFKNFIAPIGIGLALLIGSLITSQANWEHLFKLPYIHPMLTLRYMKLKDRPVLENHEWNAIGYFISVLALGVLHMKFRKEKG
ncbi:MAG TPA: hypothetical protein VM010_04765, partial [Chitinophagaceae bacterium]|nr:hypothetical protein [Chitinophagaceae bacterium]